MGAPGQELYVAQYNDIHGYSATSGTSEATALGSGASALVVSYEGLNDNTAEVYKRLEQNALVGAMTDVKPGLPNLFLQTGIGNPGRVDPHPYAGVGTVKPWGESRNRMRGLPGSKREL